MMSDPRDTPFKLGLEQKQAFQALKDELARAGTIVYFDKEALTKVTADASPVGLGASADLPPQA